MLEIDWKISVGNILTTMSILVGVATFLYNEVQKRRQADRAFAAEVRDLIGHGASESVRLENELALFFLSVEPLYVATSEAALDADSDPREKDIEQARDMLWTGITAARSDMERRVLERTTLPGGLALAGVEAQTTYEEFRDGHTHLRFEAFATLLEATQQALQDIAPDAIYTAEIGNALRSAHESVKKNYLDRAKRERETVGVMLSKELARFAQ